MTLSDVDITIGYHGLQPDLSHLEIVELLNSAQVHFLSLRTIAPCCAKNMLMVLD